MKCGLIRGLALAFGLGLMMLFFSIVYHGATYFVAPALVMAIGGFAGLALAMRLTGCARDYIENPREVLDITRDIMWHMAPNYVREYLTQDMIYELYKKRRL